MEPIAVNGCEMPAGRFCRSMGRLATFVVVVETLACAAVRPELPGSFPGAVVPGPTLSRIDVLVKPPMSAPGGAGFAKAPEELGAVTRFREFCAKPLEIGGGLWLTLAPQAVLPLPDDDEEVSAGLRLAADVKAIVTLGREVGRDLPQAVPVPQSRLVPNRFLIAVPLDVTFAALRAAFVRLLEIPSGGIRHAHPGGWQIRLMDFDVFGYGRRALIRVDFEGSQRGWMYFEGTPTYDPVAKAIRFPDLDGTLETKAAFSRAVRGLTLEQIRDDLRVRLVLSVADQVATSQRHLEEALNKRYGDVALTSRVETLQPVGIYAQSETLSFRLILQGQGDLLVTLD